MSEDKNFLQTIKLDISRNFKMDFYERRAFYRILGLSRSPQALEILRKELERGGQLRLNCLKVLASFEEEAVEDIFLNILNSNPSDEEILIILGHPAVTSNEQFLEPLISIIEKYKDSPDKAYIVRKVFCALKHFSQVTPLYQLVESILEDYKSPEYLLRCAAEFVTWTKNFQFIEELLKRGNDHLLCYIFSGLYHFNLSMAESNFEDEDISSPSWKPQEKLTPQQELMLQIKVLLGKVTARFDDFSPDTKTAFISAMLACNHRESSIFVLKALESKDQKFIKKILLSLYANLIHLKNPEKILRALMYMNTESKELDDIIVNIFTYFFSKRSTSRSDILFKDKQYGIITSTLENFFETYRREFMIPEVAENSLPDNIKSIRKFLLTYVEFETLKKLINSFNEELRLRKKNIKEILANKIPFIPEEHKNSLKQFLELIFMEDEEKLKQILLKIEDIDFEKKYLKSKIIRLCNIAGQLKIASSATILVFMYNYLKKFPEPDIFNSAIEALCKMNYSFILSEIEIMLATGDPQEQELSVRLLPLLTDRRVIGIISDFLKQNLLSDSTLIEKSIFVLIHQEIKMNINVASLLKDIISSNPSVKIKEIAIKGLGICAFGDDLDYLIDLYHETSNPEIRYAAIKAITSIVASASNYNKLNLSKFLNECLKDPNIKIRVMACMLLVRSGNREIFRTIREMLIIKNKGIQREILSIVRDLEVSDFNFFLLSLLREEFGISSDLINILSLIPPDEIKEIEGFIVNMFRKFEYPQSQGNQVANVFFTDKKRLSILMVSIANFKELSQDFNYSQFIDLYITIDSLILKGLEGRNGTLSFKERDFFILSFANTHDAVDFSLSIVENFQKYNSSVPERHRLEPVINLFTDEFLVKGEEFDDIYLGRFKRSDLEVLNSSIVADSQTLEIVSKDFSFSEIPDFLYSQDITDRNYFEFESLINFDEIADEILMSIEEELEREKEYQRNLEERLKLLQTANRSSTSVAIAAELENISLKIKEQLDEIETFINKRSTDRELNKNIRQMLRNLYNTLRIEISKIQIK